MGRAQNLHATATATPPGFAIFGRRGRPENDALLARQPSAFARAEAAPLLEAAASFESERALAALAPHAERAAGRPLLEEIADLLGQRPIETAIRTREPAATVATAAATAGRAAATGSRLTAPPEDNSTPASTALVRRETMPSAPKPATTHRSAKSKMPSMPKSARFSARSYWQP